jgi:hypothetical protein
VELLRQLVSPLLNSPQTEARKLARDDLENGTDAVASLHRILLSARIREMVE